MLKSIVFRSIICSILILNLFYPVNPLLNKEKDCKCRLVVNKRVVGGAIAPFNSYRWVAALFGSYFKYPSK